MKKTLLILSMLVSMLYAGATLSPEVKTLINVAKLQVPGMTDQETISLLKSKHVILIDVRDSDEWKDGVIKTDKLVKISRGFLEIKYPELMLKKYTKEDTFIVYCALEPRSILAASRLKELGFKNVAYLEGGMKNWTKKAYPTQKQ